MIYIVATDAIITNSRSWVENYPYDLYRHESDHYGGVRDDVDDGDGEDVESDVGVDGDDGTVRDADEVED